jgi:Fe-S-cluster-containing hydrogenase component 2
MVDGKAKVVDESLCDGAGFCLPVCPAGALSIETREAPAFDQQKADTHGQAHEPTYIVQTCFRCSTGEDRAPLLPVRYEGHSLWICTRCLPSLIHS